MIEPTHEHNPEQRTLTNAPAGDVSLDEAALAAPAGYELKSLIGEGGMGVVYRALEVAMDRDVAVKILRSRFAPESAIGRRFVEEAQITGQLQHPGIPPVHQVGTLPDGRPFLAMKLIKGKTLAELLKQRSDPGADRGRWLAIFEQVAQAVAYAHDHSVIHRDLKPANVMVGGFGEVQVMDWGLAKVLVPGESRETALDDATLGTEIRSLREGSDVTQAGSLLGTPAYMPPEQAIGAVDQITERSDVFGLGAILCVILTGKPPYDGETAESTRLMAARGKLDDAYGRVDGCGAEPELIALAKRCLAPEPGDRPRDAGEVAKAITDLRADAERRARLAEMERARSEVRASEERKRRRVKFALALTLLALVAVGGIAAFWIESVRADRRTEQLTHEAEQKSLAADRRADQLKRDAEEQARKAALLSRQLATERDVVAALNEAQVLREEGWKQSDDPARWALTLAVARSSFKRAESLLLEPTEELRARVNKVSAGLAQDERDRALLAELDKIEEENDLKYLMPMTLTGRLAERYANAFRGYGVDLLAMPKRDAVARLKGHQFRERLITAIRNWELARPITDRPGMGLDVTLIQPVHCSAAVAGTTVVHAVLTRPSIRDRLKAIAKDVDDDPFAREWWDNLEKSDAAALKKLFARPEFQRLSSRVLSSWVDALSNSMLRFEHSELLSELLSLSYDRFPGDYWVNFRLGSIGLVQKSKESEPEQRAKSIRYLTAALAVRPRSAMPRVALGMTLLEQRKDDPVGLRLLRGAAIVDPTSPWPHLMMGFAAMEAGNGPDTLAAFREAVRADPEIGFFMLFGLMEFQTIPQASFGLGNAAPSELFRFYEDLIALHTEHAGGYVLRAGFRYKQGDYRLALADYRTAFPLMPTDNPFRTYVKIRLDSLEKLTRWEKKVPAVLKGELRPNAAELVELAQYCAGFEKRYLRASRFATEAFAKDANLFVQWPTTSQLAGFAVQASMGKGVDAADLSDDDRSQLRRKAIAWLRAAQSRADKNILQYLTSETWADPNLAPVRDPKAIAKLPPEEREEWTRFWAELPRMQIVAPPPRPVKP